MSVSEIIAVFTDYRSNFSAQLQSNFSVEFTIKKSGWFTHKAERQKFNKNAEDLGKWSWISNVCIIYNVDLYDMKLFYEF